MDHLQLHGIVPHGTAQRSAAPPHWIVECGPFDALVSRFPDVMSFETLAPDAAAEWAMAHTAILCAYCRDTGVVPMRPGAVFTDANVLGAAVRQRSSALLSLLDALSDVREYTVQLRIGDEAAKDPGSATNGRAHLQQRRNRREQQASRVTERQALAHRTLNAIQTIAPQVEPAGPPKPDRILDCVILIPVTAITSLQQIGASVESETASLGMELVIQGPWPPYSYKSTDMSAFGLAHAS